MKWLFLLVVFFVLLRYLRKSDKPPRSSQPTSQTETRPDPQVYQTTVEDSIDEDDIIDTEYEEVDEK